MGQVGTLVTFGDETTLVSDDINQNFADLKAAINTALFTDVTNTITIAQRLANAIWLKGRNQANSGDLNIIRVTTSDDIELGLTTKPSTDSTQDFGTTALRWLTLWADKLVLTTETPASAAAAGTAGQIAWDTGFIYVCTATNTWERVAIATW